jgi:hypothetical protein
VASWPPYYKERRKAGKMLFIISWIHGLLIIRNAGKQEKGIL